MASGTVYIHVHIYIYIYIYISEGSAPAAGPSGNQLTADLQIRRISRILKICRIESIGKLSNWKHLSKQVDLECELRSEFWR